MRRTKWYAPRGILSALSWAVTCAGTAQALPQPTPTSDLQVAVESGDYLAPDYLSIPVYVTVTNLGPDIAEDVTVALELPPLLSSQPQGDGQSCIISGRSINCTLLPLEAGAHALVTVELFLPPEPLQAFDLRATAMAKGIELVPEDNRVTYSTSGPGLLRLTGGSCASAPGDNGVLGVLWLSLCSRRLKFCTLSSPSGHRRSWK